MKLASKYLIALGGISTVAAGAIGYGTYSAVKFNEKFQGNGWYYDGVKFDTKDEAIKEFKKEIEESGIDYILSLEHQHIPLASTLISIALKSNIPRYDFDRISELEPYYLRKSQAEIVRDEKINNQQNEIINRGN